MLRCKSSSHPMNPQAFLLAAFFAAASTQGISMAAEVSTDPVGMTKIHLDEGYNMVSVSLLNPIVFSGVVLQTSTSPGSVITVSGSNVNVGGQLDASKAYYAETVADTGGAADFIGDRFEVDVASTKTAANATIVIQGASATNTINPLPNLAGARIIVRPHVTLAQIFGGLGNMKLKGASSAGSADQVMFWSNQGVKYISYWLRSNVSGSIVQWRLLENSSDLTDYSSLPIPPGVGLFVLRQTGAGSLDIVHTGEVRMTPFRQPLPVGYSLISHSVPLNMSPAQRRMNRDNGFTGASSAGSADQILKWSNSAFQTFYLRSNVSGSIQQWRSSSGADATDYMFETQFLNGDTAMFVNKLAPDPEYIIGLP